MKNKFLPQRILIVIYATIVAIVPLGCQSAMKDDNSLVESTSSPVQTSTTLPVESTSTATATSTRKPTATFAPTGTPLPPQTDLPTIEPGSINTMIDSLYSKCELPCWGNIIPGETSQYAAKRFLSPLGEWYSGSETAGEVPFEYNGSSTSIFLGFEYGLVHSIDLSHELTKPYRINQLFNQYGMPEDVQLEILPLTAELTSWFWLIIKYPQQGFFVTLSARGTIINSIINVCPRYVSPDLYLFEENKYSLSDMNEFISTIHPHSGFQPLNTLTNIDVNQFYETFRNQGIDCIATNIKFQLP